MRFSSYSDLTDHIMDAILDDVEGSRLGVSSRSVSRYVTVGNDDGEEFRVRISDHDATASCGGGIIYEIDIRALSIEEITDDFGDFDGIEISNDYLIDEWVEEAVRKLNEVRN